MALFGFACTGVSIMNYLKPEIAIDKVAIKNKAMNDCQQFAIATGFNISKTPTELVLFPKEEGQALLNPVPYIYKASLMVEKCHNLHVKYFCMGEECEKPVIIKFEFPNI